MRNRWVHPIARWGAVCRHPVMLRKTYVHVIHFVFATRCAHEQRPPRVPRAAPTARWSRRVGLPSTLLTIGLLEQARIVREAKLL